MAIEYDGVWRAELWPGHSKWLCVMRTKTTIKGHLSFLQRVDQREDRRMPRWFETEHGAQLRCDELNREGARA